MNGTSEKEISDLRHIGGHRRNDPVLIVDVLIELAHRIRRRTRANELASEDIRLSQECEEEERLARAEPTADEG